MGAKKAAGSFIAGLLMTLILVIAVPMFVDTVVQKYIEDVVGDTTFLTLSSEFIVNLLVWLIIIGFIVLLGAGGILKRFGIFGIIGLIVAYWLLGDVTDAFIPLATQEMRVPVMGTAPVSSFILDTDTCRTVVQALTGGRDAIRYTGFGHRREM